MKYLLVIFNQIHTFSLANSSYEKLTEQRYFLWSFSRKKIKVETEFDMLASNEFVLETGKGKYKASTIRSLENILVEEWGE